MLTALLEVDSLRYEARLVVQFAAWAPCWTVNAVVDVGTRLSSHLEESDRSCMNASVSYRKLGHMNKENGEMHNHATNLSRCEKWSGRQGCNFPGPACPAQPQRLLLLESLWSGSSAQGER